MTDLDAFRAGATACPYPRPREAKTTSQAGNGALLRADSPLAYKLTKDPPG